MTRVQLQPIVASLGITLALTAAGCAQDTGATTADTPQLRQFQSAGKEASITVLPTILAGKSMKQVGEVVALLLEKAGMTNLQIASVEFLPPKDADMVTTTDALVEFIKSHPPQTDYALFTEVVASPQRKVLEVRTIVLDKAGAIVWSDQQTAAHADFKRIKPAEPMQCCLLVAERMRPILHLDDPTRANAPQGRLAKRWEQETGVPDKAEVVAMENRLKAFKKKAATATLLVYPVHAGDEFSATGAANLTALINKNKLAKAVVAEQGPKLAVQPNMNEQKVLWGMARAFRDHVRKTPPNPDYVLYAHYLMGKQSVGGVHFAICDRQGEWVIVGFQNSHQDDFQSVNPKSREDCDRLVVKRLEGLRR